MRFLIVLLALLCLTAPVDAVAEIADATSFHDDAAITYARAVVVTSAPAHSPIVDDDGDIPAAPEGARIFRPPR